MERSRVFQDVTGIVLQTLMFDHVADMLLKEKITFLLGVEPSTSCLWLVSVLMSYILINRGPINKAIKYS
jgi:hypothetical protein